jgi:hypothetical protein
MVPSVSHGRGRASAHGGVVDRLTTGQLLELLRAEGWHVTPRIVNHAESVGALPRPTRVGRYRQWRELHVSALRDYLRTQSRSQRSAIVGEVAR